MASNEEMIPFDDVIMEYDLNRCITDFSINMSRVLPDIRD